MYGTTNEVLIKLRQSANSNRATQQKQNQKSANVKPTMQRVTLSKPTSQG